MQRLSKSRYLSGLQCDKRVYLETHAPFLATPPDEETRAILDSGTDIGVLARARFPGGVLVDAGHRQTQQALEWTTRLLADDRIPAIFEAAVVAHGILIRTDILERIVGEAGTTVGWRVIEVKSSTRKKDIHLDDLALQMHVLQGAGLSVLQASIMHVNTQYVFAGEPLDLDQLFTIRDVSEEVAARLVMLPARVQRMVTLLDQPAPPLIEPGQHCHSPYACPYWVQCTKEKSSRWLHHLPGNLRNLQELFEQGIDSIDALPPGIRLTPLQERVRANVEWRSSELVRVLRKVRYPVHHLDFETIMPAVPRFPGTCPYQTVPVQWSNHIESETGEIIHHEYLSSGIEDPREELVERLLESLGEAGTICVYSTFEHAVLDALAERYPRRKTAIGAVQKRLWDFCEVLQTHYYHPDFNGSYSLKAVLPAILPSLSYADLAIRNGATAAREYLRMAFEMQDWVERDRIAAALRAYCARDTLAMLELRRALLHRIESPLA